MHEPGNALTAHLETSSLELLIDARCPVETAAPIKHRLYLGGNCLVFLGPTAWALLSLPPDIETAAGYTQLSTEPGRGEAVLAGLDQAKPLGGSCSFAKCAAANLKKSFSYLS